MLAYYFLIFYFGACWGSFLFATYQRRKIGMSIITPPSHCDFCQNQLPYFTLWPILSFLKSRGQCIFCATKIPITSCAIELIFGFIFILIFPLQHLCFINVLTFLCFSFLAIEDLAIQRIHSYILLIPATFQVCLHTSYPNCVFFIILLILITHDFETSTIFQKFGQGDLEVVIFLSMVVGFQQMNLIILLASSLALLVNFSSNHQTIPFVTYIFISYFLLCFVF